MENMYELSCLFLDDDMPSFCVMFWAIWKELCRRKHDLTLKIIPINISWATSLLHEFHKARRNLSVSINAPVDISIIKWVKPIFGHVRLDVDAGYDDRKWLYSFGAIIRDHAEVILIAKAGHIRRPGTVLGGELLALLWGLRSCKIFLVDCVDVYSNSLLAVLAITNQEVYIWHEGSVLEQINLLMDDNTFNGI